MRLRKRERWLIGLLIVLALLLRLNVRQGMVHGASMEPNYHNGDTVLVWKTYPRQWLKPGDVIVFKDRKNGDELIKRIALRESWQGKSPSGYYPNPNGGPPSPFSILFDAYFSDVRAGSKPMPPRQSTLYVLGDNLLVSDDSRHFGPISPDQILGKVVP